MEYLNYLIYPIAGFFVIVFWGGSPHPNPVVKLAAHIYVGLNLLAIVIFSWWPIGLALALNFGLAKIFGDPGRPWKN
jgi:hypothetical protein